MSKLTEKYIIERIKFLRNCVEQLPPIEKQSKAEQIQWYTDNIRIDELLELLPMDHWIKKETDVGQNNSVS